MSSSRAEQLGIVREAVKAKFPTAEITTNDDANPATPMTVTARWRHGTIIKAVRADTLQISASDFAAKAISKLSAFQEQRVPSQYQ